MTSPILEYDDLRISFLDPAGRIRAVNGATFSIAEGEIVGLVGESGSGKSLTALATLGLLPSLAIVDGGEIRFHGVDLLREPTDRLRRVRGSRISFIFQDARAALNPVLTIGFQLTRVLKMHSAVAPKMASLRARELLESVGLPDPESSLKAYPHELSGGMCQRVMIAMAIAGSPEVIIADEATSSLDVTVQATIVRLLRDMVRASAASSLFITHDLGVAAQLCDRVIVMYAGRVLEMGPAEIILADPSHPYTHGLLSSVLPVDRRAPLRTIGGSVPNPQDLDVGCKFHPRCDWAQPPCWQSEPDLLAVSPNHAARCYLVDGTVSGPLQNGSKRPAVE